MYCSAPKLYCRRSRERDRGRKKDLKTLYCGCEIHRTREKSDEKYDTLGVDAVIFCPQHMDREARGSDWERAHEEVKLYKEKLKSIEGKIDEYSDSENRDPLFREMLDCYYKLKAAELEFFSIMDTLCE